MCNMCSKSKDKRMKYRAIWKRSEVHNFHCKCKMTKNGSFWSVEKSRNMMRERKREEQGIGKRTEQSL